MQIPKRKLGNRPPTKADPYLTQEKINELEIKLKRMRNKQPQLAAEVKILASDGDFSENAGYQLAKGHLRGLNQRILDTENQLKSAIVIVPQNNNSLVQVGNTIDVELRGKRKTFTILGSAETNPLQGVISRNSPIGSAILNKKVGDIAKIKLGDKEAEYRIIKIH